MHPEASLNPRKPVISSINHFLPVATALGRIPHEPEISHKLIDSFWLTGPLAITVMEQCRVTGIKATTGGTLCRPGCRQRFRATRVRRRRAGIPGDYLGNEPAHQVGEAPPPQFPHATVCKLTPLSSASGVAISSHHRFRRSPQLLLHRDLGSQTPKSARISAALSGARTLWMDIGFRRRVI